eukprot:TRINITY_DN8304_c0_g1_i1.p1 TRINITY_DN8304_c0_g1~~TRINITY_DN8304_c0_g1_i1.p1  ORF type:complete len:748 (-),score=160.17 TRINITY_DN8304_c0_g1_i1:83-2326(-)
MSVYTWGENRYGQLGDGTTRDSLVPKMIQTLAGSHIVHVSSGDSHCLAVTYEGSLSAWGRGKEGCIGNDMRLLANPDPIDIGELRHSKIILAECGHNHSIAVTEEGELYEWGHLHRIGAKSDYFGTTISMPGMENGDTSTADIVKQSHMSYYSGDMDSIDSENSVNFGEFESYYQKVPVAVAGLLTKRIAAVSAGYSFTLCATTEGEVFSWGFNDKGQLGLGHRFNQDKPQLVRALGKAMIIQVSSGTQHSLALSSDGVCFSWGLGVLGQLGHSSSKNTTLPGCIESIKSTRMVKIACGSFHSLALSDRGVVYGWGNSEYGQQGGRVGNFSDWASGSNQGDKSKMYQNSTPRIVDGFATVEIRDIACGHLHSVALDSLNHVYTWGWGVNGQLGHGDRKFQLIPTQIAALKGVRVHKISAGNKHSAAIDSGSSTLFANDYKNAINNSQYSDAAFFVEGKKIYVHKAILSARSKVFRAMFLLKDRFSYGVEDVFVFKHIKYWVMMGLLHYIYTDHLKISSHIALELSELAKKHGMMHLHSICINYLGSFSQSKSIALPKIADLINTNIKSTFSEDMAIGLIDDTHFHDIILELPDGVRFKTSRVALYYRCKWFRTLFDSSFRENDQKAIKIDLVDPTLFKYLLQYIVGCDNTMVENNDLVVDLLAISDQFLMDNLKLRCEAHMAEEVDASNCIDILELTDIHHATRLKRRCIQVIINEWEAVSKTPEFIQMSEEQPHLVQEIEKYRERK